MAHLEQQPSVWLHQAEYSFLWRVVTRRIHPGRKHCHCTPRIRRRVSCSVGDISAKMLKRFSFAVYFFESVILFHKQLKQLQRTWKEEGKDNSYPLGVLRFTFVDSFPSSHESILQPSHGTLKAAIFLHTTKAITRTGRKWRPKLWKAFPRALKNGFYDISNMVYPAMLSYGIGDSVPWEPKLSWRSEFDPDFSCFIPPDRNPELFRRSRDDAVRFLPCFLCFFWWLIVMQITRMPSIISLLKYPETESSSCPWCGKNFFWLNVPKHFPVKQLLTSDFLTKQKKSTQSCTAILLIVCTYLQKFCFVWLLFSDQCWFWNKIFQYRSWERPIIDLAPKMQDDPTGNYYFAQNVVRNNFNHDHERPKKTSTSAQEHET